MSILINDIGVFIKIKITLKYEKDFCTISFHDLFP